MESGSTRPNFPLVLQTLPAVLKASKTWKRSEYPPLIKWGAATTAASNAPVDLRLRRHDHFQAIASTMSPFFDRLRAAIVRRGKRFSISLRQKESIWRHLPDEVLVLLLASCELEGIKSMALTCRLMHRRIVENEPAISRSYLMLRSRSGTLCSDSDSSLSPGDDLGFIADLFPPPPPLYAINEVHEHAGYSLAYLADLERCWTTCIRLSYHLADHAIRHHLEKDSIARSHSSSSKTEKELVYTKAVGALQSRLLAPIAYTVLFLEAMADDDPDSNPAGQAAVAFTSIDFQRSIFQSPPFTNTRILISTHHCMQLLCATVRRLMSPDFPNSTSNNWVSLLLRTSTLERIVDFFLSISRDEDIKSSTSPSSKWSHRKEFLWRMREDLGRYMTSASRTSNKEMTPTPTLDQVWFKAAYQELVQRGAIPHSPEEPIPVLHGSAVTLQCEYCGEGE